MAENYSEQVNELIANGDVEGAVKLLVSALQSNGRDVEAWLLLAELMDDPVRKKDCYQQVLKWSPSNATALKGLEKIEEATVNSPLVKTSANKLSGTDDQKAETDELMQIRESKGHLQKRRRSRNGYFIWAGSIFGGICFFFLCLLPVGNLIYGQFIAPTLRAPKEQRIQAELEKEFSAITPLSNNTPVYHTSLKTSDASDPAYEFAYGGSYVFVRSTYAADNFMPIVVFNHYDKQLRAQGWEFMGNPDGNGWGNIFPDIKSITAVYRKGQYCAFLAYEVNDYPSESMPSPWFYSIQLGWNRGDCSDKYE